ncbi:MAG: hypothetical protein ABI847_05870, partial [Anaerolineales bacterium]
MSAECQVMRFEKAGDFLDIAQAFLVQHEAHNCLPLGLAAQLRDNPERQLLPAYLAVVRAGTDVLAAGVMTPPRGLILAVSQSPEAVAALARDVHDFRPELPGLSGPVPGSDWFAVAWGAQTGDHVEAGTPERIYLLSRVRPQRPVAGGARRAHEGDRDLLRVWVTEFDIEAFGHPPDNLDWRIDTMLRAVGRGVYLWDVDGQPVSVAGYAGPTPHGIRIGPVYTPPDLRG